MAHDTSRKDKWQSGTITDGPTRAGARSMLFAAGFDRDALARPIIGVANTWTEIGPCNLHLRDTDGRFSGATRGLMVGHVAPEAASRGPIALLRDGEIVTLDADKRSIDMSVSAEELATRRTAWAAPAPRYKTGVMGKYARLVSSAAEGAVTT